MFKGLIHKFIKILKHKNIKTYPYIKYYYDYKRGACIKYKRMVTIRK